MWKGRRKQQSRSRRRSRPGFTLTEVLVVVGIIGVLIGFLLPLVGRARESAKLVTCASNLRQIVLLMNVYADQYRDRLPYRADPLQDWSIALVARSSDGQVFRCPADDTSRRDTGSPEVVRSYGVNCGPYGVTSGASYRAPWPALSVGVPAKIRQVPLHVILVGDNHGQFQQSAAYVGIAEAEGLDGVAWGTHRQKRGRGDNYAFADGHVEYRLKADLDALALDFAFDPANGGEGGPNDPWKWR